LRCQPVTLVTLDQTARERFNRHVAAVRYATLPGRPYPLTRKIMRPFRIQIRNFRNFRDVTCRLGKHVVLLGENGTGKSNLLYALRLLLDPALPDSDRYLDE